MNQGQHERPVSAVSAAPAPMALPVVQVVLPRLDDYCRTRCREMRCDIHRDCSMLKFQRKREITAALNDIARYLDTRHTAVTHDALVRRFFLDERSELDDEGLRYLEEEFGRILDETMQRDRRFERRHLSDGAVAWARRGAGAPNPEPTSRPPRPRRESALTVARARVLDATRPVPLGNLLSAVEDPGPERAAIEEHVARALVTCPDVRAVALDRVRGIGSAWASVAWVRARLPRDAYLPPIMGRPAPTASNDVLADDDVETEDVESVEDEETDIAGTRRYPISLDDVLNGSIVLASADDPLFPAQPNPVWLELRDEMGAVYDTLLFARDGRRELFGLKELFLDQGGEGMALRLLPTPAEHVYVVEMHVRDEEVTLREKASDVPLSRRLWRHLLQARAWRGLQELAIAADEPTERVQAVLEAYRCFERGEEQGDLWRLDPSQPGLRGPIRDRHAFGAGMETDALITHTLHEIRSYLATARQLDREIALLADAIGPMAVKERRTEL